MKYVCQSRLLVEVGNTSVTSLKVFCFLKSSELLDVLCVLVRVQPFVPEQVSKLHGSDLWNATIKPSMFSAQHMMIELEGQDPGIHQQLPNRKPNVINRHS